MKRSVVLLHCSVLPLPRRDRGAEVESVWLVAVVVGECNQMWLGLLLRWRVVAMYALSSSRQLLHLSADWQWLLLVGFHYTNADEVMSL